MYGKKVVLQMSFPFLQKKTSSHVELWNDGCFLGNAPTCLAFLKCKASYPTSSITCVALPFL